MTLPEPIWWSGDAPAAWLQAIGSLIAIGIAIYLPLHQRSTANQDARAEEARQTKEHVKSMTAAPKSGNLGLPAGARTRGANSGPIS